MSDKPQPWKIVVRPDMSCEIKNEIGSIVAKYADYVALVNAHCKALRTINRMRNLWNALWTLRNETEIVEQDFDGDERRPF